MDEIRTCNNGILSGSYAFSSCVVEEPSSCSFNGSTLENEASVVAYQTATVASGQTCSSEIRTCSNGTLSGSFQFDTCEPESIQPIIESVFVEDNLYDGTAVSVQVDSQINIRVIASDPKQLPLQYYFRFWECTPPSLTFCSSTNDSFIGYTSEEEVNYYLDKFFIDSYGKLEVKAKNSNGEIETLNIKMIYERDPSILDPSIEEIYVNGEKYIEDSELLTVRNLSINVVANDPKNLDIKYLFWIVNSSTGGVEYTQGYSSDNQVSYTLQDDYTFPNDKVYVRLYIKNTDGVEYFYGWTSGNNVYVDDQATVKLRIEP